MKKRIHTTLVALLALACSATAQSLTVQGIEAEAGEQAKLIVSLSGANAMTALQFNLALPDGVSLTDEATMGTATDGHTLNVQTLDNGDYLFILYSMDLNTFKDGELLRIPVSANKGDVAKLYNVRYADTEAVSYVGKDAESNVTGISSPQTANGILPNGKSCDLSGRKLSQMQRGINIVRMKDGTTKKVLIK